MPNHVINEVILHGVKLEDCRRHLFDKEGEFTFEAALPLPLNFWPGNVGTAHKEAFPGTHLDAARQTWGTKWDAYGETSVEQSGDDVMIRFQSAWSHPRGWTCAIFNLLNCNITAKWLSEGGFTAHVERYVAESAYEFGPAWTDEEIADGSEEHRRLHVLLWGVESFDDEEDQPND